MKTTIDAAGRVVVPKRVREAARIQAGTELEVRIENGVICLEPVAAQVKLKRRGGVLVATLTGSDAVLTREEVEATRGSVRAERENVSHGKARKS